MTIAQAERFYEQDRKEYEIETNKDFLNWFKNSIVDGYNCFIETKELQELIDNIVKWYEIKYPERELEYFEGTRYMNFQDIKKISDVMNIRQLLYRLPHNQLCLIECGYRARGWSQRFSKNGKFYLSIFIPIYDNTNRVRTSFYLNADASTGRILDDYNIKKYAGDKENINLDELLEKFTEFYANKLDFTELKKCIYDHDCDMELRHRILQLVALKLLYSRNTIPERGYERAKRFINEFNKKLGLTLSTEEIDEAINRDYTNDESWEHNIKTHVNEDKGRHSYLDIEDVVKKENQLEKSNEIKKIVRKIIKKNK